ncbi:MAG: DUF58 domain-containing protein [Egibacteraceae bacterium]
MLLTRRGVATCVAAVLCWGLGRAFAVDELIVVAAAGLLLVVTAGVMVWLSGTNVAVRRRLGQPRLSADQRTEVLLELRNEGRLPTVSLLVEDRCPDGLHTPQVPERSGRGPRFLVGGLGVRRSEHTELAYVVRGERRGRYQLGPVRIRARDPFGLVQRLRRTQATDELIVHPRVEALDPIAGSGAHRGSGSSTGSRLFNTGDEFYILREYEQGDDLRQVHWPSTARRRILMVRQNEQPYQTQAVVLLDSRHEAHRGRGRRSTLERAISASASVATHLFDRGYRLRLVTERETTQRPGNEAPALLLERLAVLEPSRSTPLDCILQRLRSGGEDGLLVAVMPAPVPGVGLEANRDLLGLVQAGRPFSARIALLVHGHGTQERRQAERACLLLSARGWRASPLAVDQSLPEAWRALTVRPARAGLAAERVG